MPTLKNDISDSPRHLKHLHEHQDVKDQIQADTSKLNIDLIREHLSCVLQPIVDSQTATAIGYEAYLKGHDIIGYPNLPTLIEAAQEKGIFDELQTDIFNLLFETFTNVPDYQEKKIFCNLTGNLFNGFVENSESVLTLISYKYDIDPSMVIFELSDWYEFALQSNFNAFLSICRSNGMRIAIDNFGNSLEKLSALFTLEPDYIKLGRNLLINNGTDSTKKLFTSKIVEMIRVIGATVIAGSIENGKDFQAARNIGCDLVQGTFIQPQIAEVSELLNHFSHLEEIIKYEKTRHNSERRFIKELISDVSHLSINDSIDDVLSVISIQPDHTTFPVKDKSGAPIGILRDSDIKSLIFSKADYKKIMSEGNSFSIKNFITKCPIVDVGKAYQHILDSYTSEVTPNGILVIDGNNLIGHISPHTIFKVISDQRVTQAIDTNPLSRLPGNESINNYINTTAIQRDTHRVYIYFDFDNFKPFNDKYGFQAGDRAILLFADVMRRFLPSSEYFLGHIGGDDFFSGYCSDKESAIQFNVRQLLHVYQFDVESLYSEEDRQQGYIISKSREGEIRKFNLMTVSAALIHIYPGHDYSEDEIASEIAVQKKLAKRSKGGLVSKVIGTEVGIRDEIDRLFPS